MKGKEVFVGLSGGVDSAVTAALLQQQGANVVGVFIKGWYPPGMQCTWSDDRRDAMRVAAHLQIPFHTLDASKEYKTGVIDYLLREYKAGRTPNPDIFCNRDVKFGAFYLFAKAHGAEFIATGHYARVEHSGTPASLLRGRDAGKDQSYFLWAVPKPALENTLFPLGEMQKSEVRKHAEHFMLPNARKRDSQGICFLGSVSVEEFLSKEFLPEPGEAVDVDGNKVGTHSGAVLWTLGQRIRLEDAEPGPWYVVAKDMEQNVLTVSKERMIMERSSIILTNTNWFESPIEKNVYSAQYRYHGPKIDGTFDSNSDTFFPTIPISETVASGQSLVLYAGDKCIGGGIIA